VSKQGGYDLGGLRPGGLCPDTTLEAPTLLR